MAAEYLLRLHRAFETKVGEGRLHHGGQQSDQRIGLGPFGCVRVSMSPAQLQCRPAGERPPRFDKGTDVEQHPPHIGMLDDRYRPARTIGAAALQAFLGIGDSLPIGTPSDAQSLDADHQTFCIHHREHGGQTSMMRADQPAGRAVIVHDAGRLGMDAHLLFQRPDRQAVRPREVAVGIGQIFRH